MKAATGATPEINRPDEWPENPADMDCFRRPSRFSPGFP